MAKGGISSGGARRVGATEMSRSERRNGACSAPTSAYAFMNKQDHEGRARCLARSFRGGPLMQMSNERLTSARGNPPRAVR